MKPTEQAVQAAKWWRSLQPDPKRNYRGDRGALARLRRCSDPLEAAAEPTALDLARQVGIRSGSDPRLGNALVAAIVLAHVRTDSQERLVRRLGAAGPNERARMSPLRLARLLAAESLEDRLVAFRRAVALAKSTADVRDLALGLLDWSQARRIEWAFAYHDTPAPSDAETPQTDSQPLDAGARA